MRFSEGVAPITAAISALSTLACCLPIGVATALGSAGVAAALAPFQGWLLGLSAVLIGAGSLQVWRTGRTCHRRSPASLIILAVSATIVATVWLFPEVIAGLLADWLP